jgi:hypothetical protein
MRWGGGSGVLSSHGRATMFAAATMDWAYIHGAGGGGSDMIGWVGGQRRHCACIYAPWSDV